MKYNKMKMKCRKSAWDLQKFLQLSNNKFKHVRKLDFNFYNKTMNNSFVSFVGSDLLRIVRKIQY